ncbi:unnamed protein product [Cochlearia groenlandica]
MESVTSSTQITIQTIQTDPNNPERNGSSSSASAVFRKIEFHPSRKPFNGISNGGSDFKMDALNPSSGNKRGFSSASSVKKHDASDSLDPELSFRITFRKIGAGLENLGNTCFLNSVLQCLTYTEPFAAYLQNAAHQKHCRVAGFCALCAMQKHVRTARQSTGRILAPKYLVSNLRCVSRNFRNFRQEDAHEFMISLLESMHKCCLPSGVQSQSSDAYKRSLVHKIFGGSLRSQVKCEQCSHCSNKYDPFLDLSLDISKADSLQRALLHFTAVEFLDDGAKIYQCERCKQKVSAKKQLTVSKAPYVLTVHLKRFEAHREEKIDRKVQFPPAIDMKPFVSGDSEGNLKYTLYGVLVHYGRSSNSGHYACFVRTSSGMWYSLDDNSVIQVSEKTVFNQKAYMLFYVRDRHNTVPKNTSSVVTKGNSKEILATNRAPLVIPSAIKDQVNGSRVTKACGLDALVTNGPAPLKSCELVVPAGLAQKDLNGEGTQKIPPSVVEAKEISKRETVSAPLESCDLGAPLVLNREDLNAKETQKYSPSIVETIAILKRGYGSASFKSCDVAPPVITPKVFNIKETLQKEVLLPQANGEVSLVKEVSEAACAVLPEQASPVLDSSTSTQVLVNLPTSGAETESSVDEKKSVNNLNENPNQLMVKNVLVGNSPDEEAVRIDHTLGQHLEESTASVKSTKAVSDRETLATPRKARKRNKKTRQAGLKIFKLSLGLRKNKKQKRDRRSALAVKSISEELPSKKRAVDQDHSTSKITSKVAPARFDKKDNIVGVHSKKIDNIDRNILLSSPTIELKERTNQNGAVLASDQQQPLENSSLSDTSQDSKRKRDSSKEEQILLQKEAINILTRGLPETVVAKWDEEVSASRKMGSKSGNRSIGYVADEWDEEYDRGKQKKIRIKEESYEGPNPFQLLATKRHTATKKKWRRRKSSAKTDFRI